MAENIKKIIIETGGKEYEFTGGGGTPAPNSVGTDEIVDGSVQMEDLNDALKEKIAKTYDKDEETLYLDFDEKPTDIADGDEPVDDDI